MIAGAVAQGLRIMLGQTSQDEQIVLVASNDFNVGGMGKPEPTS